ncbi:MAG: TetR/AcrR family transcriptional regulator [Myxococcales bacterium]|nr:TetR/AcrR family transcriptional regulator [Myxococcales bacterium]
MPEARRVPRRRRSADEARLQILEAAQQRLAASGPEGLRLQEIAADVGVSHPAILHHFGSREGLLEALASHTAERLNREIAARLETGEPALREILAMTRDTLASQGQARLLAWLALSGRLASESPEILRGLVDVAHRRRVQHRAEAGGVAPEREDTIHAILLVALSLFADALIGDLLRASLGHTSASGEDAFRDWLAALLESHLAG